MSTERNKAIARQFQTTFNERDWAGCRSLLAPDCRSYQPGAAGSLTNDELTAVGQLFASAFPDLVVNVHDPVTEDNRVVTRISFAGTQRNDCQGIPATGKRIVLEGYIMDQIVDGAIIEHRSMLDAMTLLQQLGVAPDPEAAEPIGSALRSLSRCQSPAPRDGQVAPLFWRVSIVDADLGIAIREPARMGLRGQGAMEQPQRMNVWAAGESYEPYVGRWSRRVAAEFVEWLAVPAGQDWFDPVCGTGALTQPGLDRARPRSVVGFDPSASFLDYARGSVTDPRARFEVADACAAPGSRIGSRCRGGTGSELRASAETGPGGADARRPARRPGCRLCLGLRRKNGADASLLRRRCCAESGRSGP